METQVSQEALAYNSMQVHNLYFPLSRTFQSIIGGVLTGILGFNGLWGFVLFFAYAILGSALLWVVLGNKSSTYFLSTSQLLSGWKTGLMEYLLFWIMFYNIVYILS